MDNVDEGFVDDDYFSVPVNNISMSAQEYYFVLEYVARQRREHLDRKNALYFLIKQVFWIKDKFDFSIINYDRYVEELEQKLDESEPYANEFFLEVSALRWVIATSVGLQPVDENYEILEAELYNLIL